MSAPSKCPLCATKLLPVLQAERESDVVIIAADDDVIYPPDFVATLLRWRQARPGCALGLRGWSLPPSLDWRETQRCWSQKKAIRLKLRV